MKDMKPGTPPDVSPEKTETLRGLARSYLVLYILFAIIALGIGMCSTGS